MSEPGTETWRDEQARSLLDFGQHGVRADGRFGWLTDDGGLDPSQPRPLYHAARMTHVWALAWLRTGNTEYAKIATRGLASLEDFADDANGGWFASLDSAGGVDDSTKANYAHAHVLLAASTATAAGLSGAPELLAQAGDVIVTRFWSEAEQAAVEGWDASWTTSEDYRGANSNMHSVEAYLAAGDVTGDPAWHARALSIADLVVNRHARSNGWRIPEHFTADWTPLHDYNRDRPDDRFRPYGTTPGHSFEWSRLLLSLEASLPDAPAWLLEAATGVFDTAVSDGWAADGHPGFVYTIDRHGRTVVPARLHWVACEAVLAAHALHARTGDPAHAEAARQWWRHVDEHFIDHGRGGWWQELSPQLSPTRTVWPGKPDLYHSYQALLFPSLPLAPCAAASLAEGASGRP